MSIRRFSTSVTCFKKILPAFDPGKVKNRGGPGIAFESNFPVQKRVKAWEKTGEDKETYFKRKHAHHHARDKKIKEAREAKWALKRAERGESNSDQKSFEKNDKRSFRDEGERSFGRHDKRSFRDDFQRSDRRGVRRDDDDGGDRNRRSFRRDDKREAYSGIRPSPLSEFIYGTSPVIAALKANRREYFSRLIVHNVKPEDEEIIELARDMNIKVTNARDKNELNILTNNGVHNGIVLETKPMIPKMVHNLGAANPEDSTYVIFEDVLGDRMDREFETKNPNPLGVYLDQVSDPHNIGAIIRSAYFLGADFVVLSGKNCAPLSPIVSKSSSGALEFMPVYSSTSPLTFFDKSREAGWSVVSAGGSSHHSDSKIHATLKEKKIEFQDLNTLLIDSPVLLVLGSEGEGIRTTLRLRSDYLVEIQPSENTDQLIDSLNVSVASALLIQKIMDFEK